MINFSEEVGKTYLWKSIAKNKDKEPRTPDQKSSNEKQSNSEKTSRGSAIKKRFDLSSFIQKTLVLLSCRIRKFSLNFLGPDEERPFLNPANDSTPAPLTQPLPDIVIEQSDSSVHPENLELDQRMDSTASDKNDNTKL